MRKGKSLIGLRIISQTEGAALGVVRDLIFDSNASDLLALLISERDLFGLIDAQIVPWEFVRSIGSDAIMVTGAEARVKAGDYPRVKHVMSSAHALSGTQVYTSDGSLIGSFADMCIDETTGRIIGYELSGGFISDTMSGKRFMPAPREMSLGEHVAIVPPDAATTVETQPPDPVGGLRTTVAHLAQNLGTGYNAAAEKVATTYDHLATVSVDKQIDFAVGKTAGRDVYLPAVEDTEIVPGEPSRELMNSSPDGAAPAAETLLIGHGETITREHAERAVEAGILATLVTSAMGGAAGETYANRGSLISNVREHESLAAQDSGVAVARAAEQTREHLAGAWDTVKQKVAEIGSAVQEKKSEHDAQAERAAIERVLGLPTNRVVLDTTDNVILNAGEIVTNAAVARAREAGVLHLLLAAVPTTTTAPATAAPSTTVETNAAMAIAPDTPPDRPEKAESPTAAVPAI